MFKNEFSPLVANLLVTGNTHATMNNGQNAAVMPKRNSASKIRIGQQTIINHVITQTAQPFAQTLGSKIPPYNLMPQISSL